MTINTEVIESGSTKTVSMPGLPAWLTRKNAILVTKGFTVLLAASAVFNSPATGVTKVIEPIGSAIVKLSTVEKPTVAEVTTKLAESPVKR